MKTIQEIIEIVSKETHISVLDIVNTSRQGPVILARHLSMWACRWHTKSSLERIAFFHGKKNHGTVINACMSIENQILYSSSTKELCSRILKRIKS